MSVSQSTSNNYNSNNNGRVDHNRHPFVVSNQGKICEMEVLPHPPADGFAYPLNDYEDVDEPRWNPDIHLNITDPDYVVKLDTWEQVKLNQIESVRNRKDGTTDSKLGFTAPFGLLTDEGVRVILKILRRELALGRECTTPRGNKRAIRGFWYTSPFIRDMMSCPKHLKLLERFTGEPMVPYFQYSNSPQINISRLGNSGTIDHWHYDGLTYVSVLMLSDMSQVTGGALEVLKCDKFDGLKKLERKESLNNETYTVNYEKPGMCILNHGGNVLHHVTPITHNPKKIERISVIMGFGSRNAYRPDNLCMHTMSFCDAHTKIYGYEYFRYKAWHMKTILEDFAKREKYEKGNDNKYATHLRQIAEELNRAASLIEDPTSDKIQFYHEDNTVLTSRHEEEKLKPNTVKNFANININAERRPSIDRLLKGDNGVNTERRPSIDRLLKGDNGANTERRSSIDKLLKGSWEHPDLEEHYAIR